MVFSLTYGQAKSEYVARTKSLAVLTNAAKLYLLSTSSEGGNQAKEKAAPCKVLPNLVPKHWSRNTMIGNDTVMEALSLSHPETLVFE